MGDPHGWDTGIPETARFRPTGIDGTLDASDPAAEGWIAGAAIAALGIDLRARRRARLNGVLSHVAADHAVLAVRQAFGNCPQYIYSRTATFSRDPALPWSGSVESFDGLSKSARAVIDAADTFFVASYTDQQDGNVRSADVSHRGGKPGFVRVRNNELTIPDFRGNHYFNTLGNFVHTPRAGLTFVNFENGDLLQVTGDVTLTFEGAELADFVGAERLWRLQVRRSFFRERTLPLHFVGGQPWPQSLATGAW
ncbi:MAG: pyridoxamine 5'-phosphate oxidase family protein [Gammaproteobacteria bacterium]